MGAEIRGTNKVTNPRSQKTEWDCGISQSQGLSVTTENGSWFL